MTPTPPTDKPADEHGAARPAAAPEMFEVEHILASVRRRVRQQKPPQDLPSCPIAPRELPAGTHLQGYTLLRVLGAGGFAVTYLAEEDATGKRVVIKEHFPEYLCHRVSGSLEVRVADEDMEPACETAKEHFLREHRLLASLDHPHIPRASACFETHNSAYYASEYIEGISLGALAEDYATRGHHVPQEEAYATLVRLLDALDYLHGKSILHRDIKPENILITRDGLPMLIDFGAAHELHLDKSAHIVESPGFSPAEQGHEQGKLGPWTDIYALGATFYYLLSGKVLPPCRRRELIDTARPLVQHRHLRAHYHPRLLASIDRATRPHATARYRSVAHWLSDLRHEKAGR